MLKSVRIKNFQNHRDTDIELCPGVNVITGTSDNGKSAIVRAIAWVVHNRPSGMAFRNHEANKADEQVEVTLETTDGVRISRKKDTNNNLYEITRGESVQTCKALRTDVPDEVSAELGLGDINLQSQFTTHFLLSESSGEVGRRLNDLVGLDVIDESLRRVNGIATEAKRESASLAVRVRRLECDLDRFRTLPRIEADVEAIERKAKELQELREDARALTEQIDKAALAKRAIDELSAFDGANNKIAEIEHALHLQEVATARTQWLRKIIGTASKAKEWVDDYADWLTIEEHVEAITKAANAAKTGQENAKQLRLAVRVAESTKRGLSAILCELEASEKALADMMSGIDICPLCERLLERP